MTVGSGHSDGTVDTRAMEITALGRPFSLGMLYDCRDDTLIPGVTLWNRETLGKHVAATPQDNTAFECIASDTVSDKSSALNISASLKASFLCGLIKVGGSASYLNDTKTSKNQARVTLKYSRTTRFEQLSMDHLGIQNMTYHDVFDKGTATHVVTGILYGAQAFFIFDREVSTSESTQDIQGNLQVMIKKLPLISIEGKGELIMNDKEKQDVKTFSCKFHGDFSLDRNPTTYDDAVKIYTDLPKLLGKNGEKAVPVKVWLYPLRKLDSRAAQLVREISANLVFKTEKLIQQMIDVTIQCNDLMRHPTAETFPDVKSKILLFREQCEQFTLTFQKQLAQTLPSIRGGGSEEAALADILTKIKQSPFGKFHITQFLSRKQQEMDTVSSYLKVLSNIKVLPTESEITRLISDPMIDYVVCYHFTSLNEEETYLSDMCNWLQSPGHTVYENKNISSWFKDKDVSMRARRCVRAFQEFAEVNASTVETQFIVSSVPDQSNPGVSIYLYEGGELLSETFKPPIKPHPPVISGRTHDSIELTLSPADFGKEFIDGYHIEYRCTEEENWSHFMTKNKDKKITVTGLKPNTKYQFRYSAVCKPGLSAASNVTGDEKTLPTSPPEAKHITAEPSYIILHVKEPTIIGDGVTISEYRVEYKVESEKQAGGWIEYRSGSKVKTCNIEGLKPITSYIIRVSAICGDSGVSAPSHEFVVMTTKEQPSNLKKHNKENSILLQEKEKGKPSVYQLNMDLCDSGYRKYSLGKGNLQKPNKVILLVGATGTGKTTLINGMANYILGVEWKDDFRFQLVHEVTDKSQAHSQTSLVTAYKMNHERGYQIPYSLTVIDTPGFGDTRGIAQDKKITEDIHAFFTADNGIDQIDAVCFVVQASLARLTHTQKYIFNAIFSIFGKDIRDNILILINFSDGERPPIIEAIKAADVPCPLDRDGDPVHFKFNNSALFANNQASNMSFNEMFWTMGTQSMRSFFSDLSKIETKSLTLTKEVLKERKQLEITVQALQPQIKAGLMKLDEIRKTQEALQQNKDRMAANKDFEYEVEITVPIKIDITGSFITNCQQCHFTCHYPCGIPNDSQKDGCAAMHNGYCTQCPAKCIWNVHFNQKYKFKYENKKEKRTYAELKNNYEAASGKMMTVEKLFKELKMEYDIVKEAVFGLIDQSSQSLKRLREIALRPNPLSTTEYIDLMIQSEEQEAKSGYQERIKSLHEVREQAGLLEKIQKKEKLLPDQQENPTKNSLLTLSVLDLQYRRSTRSSNTSSSLFQKYQFQPGPAIPVPAQSSNTNFSPVQQ
ncbi:uncharacterized protein LOC135057172 [Pseudophryne corroboree]|uniref:uncharacterized protein LOC135057172 n=1 Tax=Pseudophryne corroboree TaxID=495146 RepID=UPI003081A4F0